MSRTQALVRSTSISDRMSASPRKTAVSGVLAAITSGSDPLEGLERACQLLAECTDLAELRQIRNLAEAARAYARAIDRGLEAQNSAAEIKIRAERRAGELLAGPDSPVSRGGNPKLHDATLQDLGIAKRQSHRWQQMARVPEDRFEAHLEAAKSRKRELSSTGVYTLARQSVRPPRVIVPDGHQLLMRFCPPSMDSPEILKAIVGVAFPDAQTAIDMTFGSGAFWGNGTHLELTAVDVNPDRSPDGAMDFRNTDYQDEAFDLAVLDPPHLEDAGEDSIMGQRYGTYAGATLWRVISDGAIEAWRIARLGVIVKVTDAVHGQQFVEESQWVRKAVGVAVYEVIHQTRERSLPDPKWGDQLSAYNNGATYLVFRKDGPKHIRRKS